MNFSETALVSKCIELWKQHDNALSENWDETGKMNNKFDLPKDPEILEDTSFQ